MRRLLWVLWFVGVFATGCAGAPPAPAPKAPYLKATPQPGVNYVGIIGDAYSVGSGSRSSDPDAWPTVATTLLRGQGVNINASVGASPSSGYVLHGPNSAKFIDLAKSVVGQNQNLVILFGSARDKTALPDTRHLEFSVQLTLEEVRKLAPNARILVVGPADVQSDPSAEVQQVRDVIRHQAETSGAMFVDPLAERWFADRPETIGESGDRPNAAGHILLADRIAPLIGQLISSTKPREAGE